MARSRGREEARVSSLRTVISVSALLAVVSFVLVMVFAPVRTPEPGAGAPFVASVHEQAERIQRALVDGRALAASGIADRMTVEMPDNPEAWLWRVQVAHATGDAPGAVAAARRLRELLNAADPRRGPLTEAAWSYRMGWAHEALGEREPARSYFRNAAGSYESAAMGVVRESLRLYNLACYRAMAGDLDAAAALFAQAVDANYGRDAGWWRVDPDLNPIREHRAFRDAAVVLTRREQERAERIRRAQAEREAAIGQSPEGPGPDAEGADAPTGAGGTGPGAGGDDGP